MYCTHCGKEINNDAEMCVHCGRTTGTQKVPKSYEIEEPKTAIGIILAFCLGLIGLAIGLLLYPSNTLRRSTFIKGWTVAIIIRFFVVLLLSIVAIVVSTKTA